MESLAELEIFHSRPFAPTRRIALGRHRLPADPAPGPGGVLLGAVMAHHRAELDDDGFESLLRLSLQVQEGQRIVQPRLRHRFQQDVHGLTRSRARLQRESDGMSVHFDNRGTGLQLMLGAVYTAGVVPPPVRRHVMDALRRGLRWHGPLDRTLFAHLSGLDTGRDSLVGAYEDPVGWAMGVLGFASPTPVTDPPERRAVQRRFRAAVRAAHPDHGGDADDAARRIDDLTEARRILLS